VHDTKHPTGRGGELTTVAGTFLAYGAVFFDRLAPLYLVALIARDLGVPSAYEGTLALLIGLGWAAAMPLVRGTSGRYSDRNRIVVGAVVAAAFGALSAAAGGWVVFVLLRGIGGLAAATGAPAATSLVFAAAPAHRRGLDLGIVQSSTRIVGSLIAPIVVTVVAVQAGWRTAMIVSAGLLLLSALLLAWAVPEGRPSARPQPASTPYALLPGGQRNVVLCTVACVLLLAWLTVWSQSAVPLVQGWLTVDADAAGRLVGWFGVGSGIAALLVPLSSDRIGRRAALATGAGLGGAGGMAVGMLATAGAVPPRPVVIALLLLAGVAMGGLPLVISIVPAEAVASGDVGRALTGPIAGGEILGAAALPAAAAAAAVPLGLGTVVAITAGGVLALTLVSALLRPLGGAPEVSDTSTAQPVHPAPPAPNDEPAGSRPAKGS
jgi:MFS family permease